MAEVMKSLIAIDNFIDNNWIVTCQYTRNRISFFIKLNRNINPFTADPVKVVHFAILVSERQSTRMSKIKNGGPDQYGAEPFEQQQFGTAGVEGVNTLSIIIIISSSSSCNENLRCR